MKKRPNPAYVSLDDWICHEAIPFSLDSIENFETAVDRTVASPDSPVDLLGFGEALHGGREILLLRNRLFRRLVEEHGYSAIALESSFPRARLVNEYVAGCGPASYEAVQEAGFSHGFGRFEANRELVEWMRQYNADPSHRVKLRFYGFDSPTEMTHSDSPRQLLQFVLDYLDSIDGAGNRDCRERIDRLLGQDADWENPAAMMDPARSIGLSPAVTSLRIETEDLIEELQVHRPDLVAKSDEWRYLEAVHYASTARQLLNYHAAVARPGGGERTAFLLGIRDAMMAENLAYLVSREHGRGKVLAFGHNSHLRRGRAAWQLGPTLLTWWPAGAHLDTMFGPRYAVIGSAVGTSEANGIGRPEANTLEARLTAVAGPARFIPTHRGQGLPAPDMGAIPIRSGSRKNSSYFPLTPESLSDFDWLAVLDTMGYDRGGPPLVEWDANPGE
ncbi:erythromycin esterase family protein [Methanosphaerula palustris]|uniref:Erythromycin esterase n=1 Tax=Methanosphaerula palustris (strain ATCC BAA-1556 / DSM 19958 / E1-9c) TaxID=521011 RepID=B8GDQ9_METPE|nr:erythromycin esterase family protein [Methanosphaerula palustris]ACL17410.1 Erythromycin esterase [Methanosphaerula palustris E1-9c]